MANESGLPSFDAQGIRLRRGSRILWEDATWRIQGPTVILGGNGSGKSSTLQMLAGHVAPEKGLLTLRVHGEDVVPEAWMTSCAVAAPWASLPGQMTLSEALAFHGTFQHPRPGCLGWPSLLEGSGLRVDPDVPLRQWSSGQRQRLHLALAMGTDVPVVLLDEPSSNLDEQGTSWMAEALQAIAGKSTVVVATNTPQTDAPPSAAKFVLEKSLAKT